jgi:hypothetical protein
MDVTRQPLEILGRCGPGPVDRMERMHRRNRHLKRQLAITCRHDLVAMTVNLDDLADEIERRYAAIGIPVESRASIRAPGGSCIAALPSLPRFNRRASSAPTAINNAATLCA